VSYQEDWTAQRRLLEQRRDDLKRVILDSQNVVRQQLGVEDSASSPIDFNHPADLVAGDPDYEKEIQIVERSRAEFSLVMHALRRIDDDDYGSCEACGIDVAAERLKAVPHAKFCLDCQSRDERQAHIAAISSRIPGTETRGLSIHERLHEPSP
jgi:DnaK suppressor protein